MSRWRRPSAVGVVGALAMAAMGWWASASADDAPPPLVPVLERLFPRVRESATSLPPFLSDTELRLRLRSYYFSAGKPDGTDREALATGGWLAYRSGWLLDTFAIGATLFGSAPLYAPDDRDGTLLLKPGQNGYYVPGEAWAALRYEDYALLTGYRQRVDQPYINSQDNRMTPNTFEGVTLGGKVGVVQYLAAYLWNIKPRNSDKFVSMSSAAGVKGQHDGVGMAGVQVTPLAGLRIDVSNQYGEHMFNTAYGEVDYRRALNDDWSIRLGAQFTDQRAVGDARVANARDRYWATQTGGTRAQVIYREVTLTGAFSITGAGNTIQSPWGTYPGYLNLIDQEFDRANEHAWFVGVAYDFSRMFARGLGADFKAAWGRDALNPATRRDAPNQAEYDLTVDYRFPGLRPTALRGLWFRARNALIDQEGAKHLGYEFRLTVNWERNLF